MSKIYATHKEYGTAVSVRLAVLDTDDIRAKAPELSKLSDQELVALLGKSDIVRDFVYEGGEVDGPIEGPIEGVMDVTEQRFDVELSLSDDNRKLIGELIGDYAKVDVLLNTYKTWTLEKEDDDLIDEVVALAHKEVAHV